MLLDELPDIGHINFQQCVDGVVRPIHIEGIVSAAPSGWDLYDAIREGELRHKNASPTESATAEHASQTVNHNLCGQSEWAGATVVCPDGVPPWPRTSWPSKSSVQRRSHRRGRL